MIKGRRVGTFTAGLMLVAFGALFLLRLVIPTINYRLILEAWPVILIFLGIEILISYFVNNGEKLKYDGGSIVLVMILSFFSMGMACAEFAVTHAQYGRIFL